VPDPPPLSWSTACPFPPGDGLDDAPGCLGGHIAAGAGFYFLKPYFPGNPAFTLKFTDLNTAPGLSATMVSSQQQDFCYGPAFVPLIWLGFVSDGGLGIRARWWHFDESDRITAGNNDGTGATVFTSASAGGLSVSSPGYLLSRFGAGTDLMTFESNLKLDVWDLEATQDFQAGRWSVLLAGGVRYAHLSQDYNAFRFNSGPGGTSLFSQDSATLLSGHNFNVTGPTVCLEVRRPLGNTGLSLYGNGRGSMLFGYRWQQADRLTVRSGTTAGVPFNVTSLSEFTACQDAVLPVTEVEIGAEYTRVWGRLQPFLRAGLVGQTWFGAGNAAGAGGNLGFFGLTVTAGVGF
jgi:hypothetical protein